MRTAKKYGMCRSCGTPLRSKRLFANTAGNEGMDFFRKVYCPKGCGIAAFKSPTPKEPR